MHAMTPTLQGVALLSLTLAAAAQKKSDKQILLQGTALDFGWTLALDQQAGEMTLTFVDRTRVVVLTGSCTPA